MSANSIASESVNGSGVVNGAIAIESAIESDSIRVQMDRLEALACEYAQ